MRLTPFQQKLAGLEKALPAALGKQAVAVLLSIVVMLACFFGFGGAKLRAKYDSGEELVYHWRGRRQRLYPE